MWFAHRTGGQGVYIPRYTKDKVGPRTSLGTMIDSDALHKSVLMIRLRARHGL